MSIIDSDLLSIQESRILLESAIRQRELLKEQTPERIDQAVNLVIKYFENNIQRFVESSFEESHYGIVEDELCLAKYYLEHIRQELDRYPRPGMVIKNEALNNQLALPKGICMSILPAYLSVLSTIQTIILSLHTSNPVILVPNTRNKNTIIEMVEEIQELLDENLFSKKSISILKNPSACGEKQLYRSQEMAFVIEHTLYEKSRYDGSSYADWFTACIGNNIVFVEKTANLDQAARDIVESKAFNNGLLAGVEQALVVEDLVFVAFKLKLEQEGAYFLSEDEHKRLEKIIYTASKEPRKELLGRTAKELCEIAEINVPEDTKILVVTKPYVSIDSPYSKEKYNPILSLYIEDDWRHACEKCIELILNDEKGQSLSIYTKDSYVIEQFIEKKPVARILNNLPTGLASVGLVSDLPLSFALTTKQVGGVSSNSLIPNHFMFFRDIALEDMKKQRALEECRIEKEKDKRSLFNQMVEKLQK